MTTIKAAADPSELLALADQQASARKRYHESDAALILESEIIEWALRRAAAPAANDGVSGCYPDKERALLAKLVYEAMRFSIWAAGQGIMADLGEPTLDPEDFLFDYSKAMDVDDWEGLAEVARDAIGVVQGRLEPVSNPYIKDLHRQLIQHRVHDDEWIVWNWDKSCWDEFRAPIASVSLPSTNGGSAA